MAENLQFFLLCIREETGAGDGCAEQSCRKKGEYRRFFAEKLAIEQKLWYITKMYFCICSGRTAPKGTFCQYKIKKKKKRISQHV